MSRMKRHQGFKRLLAVLVFTLVSLAITTGVALASYGEAPPLTTADFTAANGGPAAAEQPAATPNPLENVQRVKITSKSIVVTFDAPGRKGKKRNMVIDYSELVPGAGTTQQAGAAGAATSGRNPLVYLIGGLVGLNLLGRVRRTVRRVVR